MQRSQQEDKCYSCMHCVLCVHGICTEALVSKLFRMRCDGARSPVHCDTTSMRNKLCIAEKLTESILIYRKIVMELNK